MFAIQGYYYLNKLFCIHRFLQESSLRESLGSKPPESEKYFKNHTTAENCNS